MARLSGLSEEQVARIHSFVSQGTGCEWVDDRKVLSAIIHGTRRGLHRVDAPYNRCCC